MSVVMQSGSVLVRGGSVLTGCAGCPTMQASFSFVGEFGTPFVDITLTWSATAVGGVSPGWRYFAGAGLTVCNAGGGPELKLKEIVFWCSGTTWVAEIVVLFNGIQDSYATVGGSLSAFTVVNPSSPRVVETRTPGDSLDLCDFGAGHLLLHVAVA